MIYLGYFLGNSLSGLLNPFSFLPQNRHTTTSPPRHLIGQQSPSLLIGQPAMANETLDQSGSLNMNVLPGGQSQQYQGSGVQPFNLGSQEFPSSIQQQFIRPGWFSIYMNNYCMMTNRTLFYKIVLQSLSGTYRYYLQTVAMFRILMF